MELETRNKIVEDNLSSIDIAMRKQDRKKSNYDDYYQILSLKLIELTERFEPDRETKFSTFAYMPLRNIVTKMNIKEDKLEKACEITENLSKPEEKDGFLDYFKETLPFNEKRIIDMKLAGYNNGEILKELDLTKCQLRNLIKKIYEKARKYAEKESFVG